MWQSILTAVASVFTKETIASIGRAILASQVRSTFKRAIRDIVEDEVADALRSFQIREQDIAKYISQKKYHYKDEISARFNALLMKD